MGNVVLQHKEIAKRKEWVQYVYESVLFDWRRPGSRSPAPNEDALSNPLTAQEGNSFGAPEKVID